MKLMTSCAAIAILALAAPAVAQTQPTAADAKAHAGHDMGAMKQPGAAPAASAKSAGADVSATEADAAATTQPQPAAQPTPAADPLAEPATPAAAAQPAPTAAPAPAAQPAPAQSAAPMAATGAAADVSVTTGMTVKDNTGASIGSVSEVKTDAAGAKVATIKMGTEVFAVDTTSLAVKDGSATINATQAEIKDMMKKK